MTGSTGDEPGTTKGAVSTKDMDAAKFLPASSKVQIEGQPVALDFYRTRRQILSGSDYA